MKKAVEEVSRKSPLDAVHSRLGATMQERDGWLVPASYGDVLSEYGAVRDGGAGLLDLSSSGRIYVNGSEAVSFLNGLITNDMKTLAENHWMAAAFPNVQGRLVASAQVVRFSDGFLITTEASTYAHVLAALNRFTLAGDFHITDLTAETAVLSLQGREALQLAQTVFGEIVTTIGPNGAIQKDAAKIIHVSHTAEDGLDLLVSSNDAVPLWEALVGAGAKPVGHDALEVLRIEAGIPRYGVDVDETTVVPEAGLDDAVSYTKGCYIGQEIIARIKYRGHVAKKLTGVWFAGRANVEPAARIRSIDDREIGRLTSVTYSPRLERTIALGYAKYDYLAGGTVVKAASGESEIQAEIHELPFVRGRWGHSDE